MQGDYRQFSRRRPVISQEQVQELVRKQEIYFIPRTAQERRPHFANFPNHIFAPTKEQLEMHLQRTIRPIPTCHYPVEARMVEEIVAAAKLKQEENNEIPPPKHPHHRKGSMPHDEQFLETLGLPNSAEFASWSRRVYLLVLAGLKIDLAKIEQIKLVRRRAKNRLKCRQRYHDKKRLEAGEQFLELENEMSAGEVIEEGQPDLPVRAEDDNESMAVDDYPEQSSETEKAVQEEDLPIESDDQVPIEENVQADRLPIVSGLAEALQTSSSHFNPALLDLQETPVFRTRYQAREYQRQKEDYAIVWRCKEESRLRKERVMRETGLTKNLEAAEVFDLFYVSHPLIPRQG